MLELHTLQQCLQHMLLTTRVLILIPVVSTVVVAVTQP